jgi:hypothetical protein|tara:strand:+ start:823 stop:1032 length:210 start_codon:yes stop_codon:yes gene_type:complete
MTLLEEAQNIVDKKNLSVDDYNRFVQIGKELTDENDKYLYSWSSEAFSLRLPEIAKKVGNYSFVKDEEF